MRNGNRRAAPLVTETSAAGIFSRRAVLLGAAQGTLATLLAARMGYIAIAQNQRYAELAEDNRVQERLIAPRRGWIVDRYGQPIAINRSDYRVDIIPDKLDYASATALHDSARCSGGSVEDMLSTYGHPRLPVELRPLIAAVPTVGQSDRRSHRSC